MRRSVTATTLSDNGEGVAPSDPNATPEARALFTTLLNLKHRSTNRVISGQRHRYIHDTIYSQTGIHIGLLSGGPDGMHGTWESFGSDIPGLKSDFLAHAQAGGIICVDFIPRNPLTREIMRSAKLTDAQMVAARTNDGNAINANLRYLMDVWAELPLYLQSYGVPIIVRNLIEHNGTNFWYWDSPECPALYRYMRTYLLNLGIHNALWAHPVGVWGNNNGPPSDPHQYMTFYPGDDVIDILGCSLYKDIGDGRGYDGGFSDFKFYEWFVPKTDTKIIALTEYGPTIAEVKVNADLRKLINGIRTYAPNIAYWNCWSGPWSMDSNFNSFVPELLNDSWVANRGDF